MNCFYQLQQLAKERTADNRGTLGDGVFILSSPNSVLLPQKRIISQLVYRLLLIGKIYGWEQMVAVELR